MKSEFFFFFHYYFSIADKILDVMSIETLLSCYLGSCVGTSVNEETTLAFQHHMEAHRHS